MNALTRISLAAVLASCSLAALPATSGEYGEGATRLASAAELSSGITKHGVAAARSERVCTQALADGLVVTPMAKSGARREVRADRLSVDSGRGTNGDQADVEGIVPAIYTWSPEVRFVFYRNIGKWM